MIAPRRARPVRKPLVERAIIRAVETDAAELQPAIDWLRRRIAIRLAPALLTTEPAP